MDTPHHSHTIGVPVGAPLVGALSRLGTQLDIMKNQNIGQWQRTGQPQFSATTSVALTMRW